MSKLTELLEQQIDIHQDWGFDDTNLQDYLNDTEKKIQEYYNQKFEKALGGYEGGRYYSTRKWKEINGLDARNELKKTIKERWYEGKPVLGNGRV